jgi:fatty acid desaturase
LVQAEYAQAATDVRSKKELHEAFFRELRDIISKEGLLKPHDRSFYAHCLVVLALCPPLLYMLLETSGVMFAFAAIFAGITTGWIGHLGHDSGHGQAPKHSKKMRRIMQLVLGNYLLGFSSAWWVQKHTLHHKSPNNPDDPDINFALLAFSKEQAQEKPKTHFRQFLLRNQWWIFCFLIPFQAINARWSSIRFLGNNWGKKNKGFNSWAEALGIAVYFVVYASFLYYLGLYEGTVFLVLHQATHGVYNGVVFATNHKGMKMYLASETPTFLELQIETSRNVTAPSYLMWLLTWMQGGLNYQVEHHLFPTMPRANLKKAAPIVKEFCQEHGIAYYATGVFRSYYEVFHNFKSVATELSEEGIMG